MEFSQRRNMFLALSQKLTNVLLFFERVDRVFKTFLAIIVGRCPLPPCCLYFYILMVNIRKHHELVVLFFYKIHKSHLRIESGTCFVVDYYLLFFKN